MALASPAGEASGLGTLGERVALTCLKHFIERLPRTGKPQPNETTVLAAFALTRCQAKRELEEESEIKVVAVGTGTKCLSASKRSSTGDTIHDSHAEVIARRALLRWLWDQINTALDRTAHSSSSGECIFELVDDKKQGATSSSSALPGSVGGESVQLRGKLKVKDGWKLHFFVSQMPCGDACIFKVPQGTGTESRTGAKEITKTLAVPLQTSVDSGQQSVGRARRKPGKGEATLSMSCSDKIAKWLLLGVQGCLLSHLLRDPLCIDTIIILVDCQEREEETLKVARDATFRALVGRTKTTRDKFSAMDGFAEGICRSTPSIDLIPCAKFSELLQNTGLVPEASRQSKSGVSINWSAEGGKQGMHEVTSSASGKKAGANKRLRTQDGSLNLKVVSTISRFHLKRRFEQAANVTGHQDNADLKRATRYWKIWQTMKEDQDSIFAYWISKEPRLP